MCGGASSQQNALSQQTSAFYKELQSAYDQTFGENQSILNDLHKGWEPIFNAGINQQGWSPAEAAAINTSTINSVGSAYKNAANATAEVLASRGGGNEPLPSGVDSAIQTGVAEKAASQLASEQNQNTIANYAQGRQNFLSAAGALSGVAAQENPLGFADAAGKEGDTAFAQMTQINEENNSWKNDLIGGLTGMAGSFLGGFGGLVKSKGPSTGGVSPTGIPGAEWS